MPRFPVERSDLIFGDSLLSHPGIDERVAEGIGESVGQQTGKPIESEFGKIREDENFLGGLSRHRERGEIDTALAPFGRERKSVVAKTRVQRHRTHALAPGTNFNDLGRLHEPDAFGFLARRTRCGGFGVCSIVSGLIVGSGASASIPFT